jgi:predicted  nucleic acid-binding Zn-ribbon protein
VSDLSQLLVVQELDNQAGALRHRLATLPERRALDDVQARIDAIDAEIAAVDAPRRQLETEQRRLEDEVASLRAKAADHDRQLYSGSVTAVRELQALQEEIDSLRRRAAQLEDQVLELMVEIEPMSENTAGLRERRAALEAEAERATVALAEAQASTDAELTRATAARAEAAAVVPSDALDRYGQLRGALAPSTVVRLVGSRCEGCPLQMPAVEVDRIKHLPAGLAECDECGRIVLH